MKDEIQKWIEMVKTHKEVWAKSLPDSPDMPPFVFAERNGHQQALVICAVKHSSRDEALLAAQVCRVGMGSDAFTLVLDSHVTAVSKEDDLKNYKPGDLQRICDEEGACATRKITDTMFLLRITQGGPMWSVSVPYLYDTSSKYKGFQWLDNEIAAHEEGVDGAKLGGYITDCLKQIMAEKALVFAERARELAPDMTDDRMLELSVELAKQHLHSLGYTLMLPKEVQ